MKSQFSMKHNESHSTPRPSYILRTPLLCCSTAGVILGKEKEGALEANTHY
jgi:hypothetical protein